MAMLRKSGQKLSEKLIFECLLNVAAFLRQDQAREGK